MRRNARHTPGGAGGLGTIERFPAGRARRPRRIVSAACRSGWQGDTGACMRIAAAAARSRKICCRATPSRRRWRRSRTRRRASSSRRPPLLPLPLLPPPPPLLLPLPLPPLLRLPPLLLPPPLLLLEDEVLACELAPPPPPLDEPPPDEPLDVLSEPPCGAATAGVPQASHSASIAMEVERNAAQRRVTLIKRLSRRTLLGFGANRAFMHELMMALLFTGARSNAPEKNLQGRRQVRQSMNMRLSGTSYPRPILHHVAEAFGGRLEAFLPGVPQLVARRLREAGF